MSWKVLETVLSHLKNPIENQNVWYDLHGDVPIKSHFNVDAAVVILLHVRFQDDELADRTQPISEPIASPKKETAWERGLKLAREVSTELNN